MIEETILEGKVAGQNLRVTGRDAIYIVLLGLFAGGVAVMLWERANSMSLELSGQTLQIREQHDNQSSYFRKEHQTIESSIKELRESLDEQTYVSTLNPEQKSRLNRRMTMPPSLRRKVGGDSE